MFGLIEEVTKVKSRGRDRFEGYPLLQTVSFFILVKEQEVQGPCVDTERLIEWAKWRWTHSLSMKSLS